MSADYQPRCVYLNCKSMQVWGEDFQNDPEFQAGMVDFWCDRSGQPAGPDGGAVALQMCSHLERPCFREFAEILPPPTSNPESVVRE